MTDKRLLIHAVFLMLATIIAAWFGLSVFTASLLALLLLVWRWSMDRLGVPYPEAVAFVSGLYRKERLVSLRVEPRNA